MAFYHDRKRYIEVIMEFPHQILHADIETKKLLTKMGHVTTKPKPKDTTRLQLAESVGGGTKKIITKSPKLPKPAKAVQSSLFGG